jgi:hypothetical protein
MLSAPGMKKNLCVFIEEVRSKCKNEAIREMAEEFYIRFKPISSTVMTSSTPYMRRGTRTRERRESEVFRWPLVAPRHSASRRHDLKEVTETPLRLRRSVTKRLSSRAVLPTSLGI